MNAQDGRLLRIAYPLLEKHGYTLGEAKFVAFKDFKFTWKFKGRQVSLSVTDYIDDAPDEALEQFIAGILTYVYGGRHVFGKEYLEYISSDEFILRKRPVFIKRSRRLTHSDMGRYRNLFDSVQRLLDHGLLTEDDIANSEFSWSTGSNTTRLGYCAQMFRVVMISSVFDDPEIDETLLDYVVYHECLHLRQGYRPFNRHPHDAAFKKMEKMFPDQPKVEEELRRTLKIVRLE